MSELDLPQEVVAIRVHPEVVDELERMDPGELRLRHLLPAHQQPSVRQHGLRHGQARGHQHGRPDHRVEPEDVLAHHVRVGRPRSFEPGLVDAEPRRGDVVLQRVDPHVDDVLGVPRHRDAPFEAHPRQREILQTSPDERHHLVAALLGQHELLVLLVEIQEFVPILRKPEEVVLLFEPLHRRAVDRAQAALEQLGLDLVLLAAHAVRAAIGARVDVVPVLQQLHELLDGPLVALLGGPDEVVVRDQEARPHLLPPGDDLVGPGLRVEPALLRRERHLLAVFVRAGEEEHLLAAQSAVAGDHVAGHGGVGVADVRHVVHVVDGGRDVEGVFRGRHGPAIVGLSRGSAVGGVRPSASR